MSCKELRQRVEDIQPQLTPIFVENAVQALLRQGEDVGGGINTIRLVKLSWPKNTSVRQLAVMEEVSLVAGRVQGRGLADVVAQPSGNHHLSTG